MQSMLPERLLNRGFCFGHLKYYPYYPIMFWGGEDYIIIGQVGENLFSARKYIPVNNFLGGIHDLRLIKLKDVTFHRVDIGEYRKKSSLEELSKFAELRTNVRVDRLKIKDWIDHLRDIEELNPVNFHHNIAIWI